MSLRASNIYLVCLLVNSLLNNIQSARVASRLLVVRVGPCYERKVTEVMKVSEMTLSRNKNDESLSGLFNITRDIEDGWIIKATMQKCNDVRNLDTCDLYKVINLVKDGCGETEDSKFYNVLFRYVTPKLQCPIKAGTYKITNFPFFKEGNDLTATESKISTSVFGYTFKIEGFNEDEDRLFCLDSQLRLLYARNHDWVGDKKVDSSIMSDTLPKNQDQHTTEAPINEAYDELPGNQDENTTEAPKDEAYDTLPGNQDRITEAPIDEAYDALPGNQDENTTDAPLDEAYDENEG